MKINDALHQFHQDNNFDIAPVKEPLFVEVFVGCLLIPLPNVGVRRKYIKYHDLHHIITNSPATVVGEGLVSAWELGTGSIVHPVLMFMNLIAISTALFFEPRALFRSYLSGFKSRNLYCPHIRRKINSGEIQTIEQLKENYLNCYPTATGLVWAKLIFFSILCVISLVVHVILVIPALIYKKGWGYYFSAKKVKVIKVPKVKI